ncbi:MAG: hypothetical protein IPI49_32145 [Myxococcales bacterium]|nr:hypothetical protein [Myxococcales bacterium]
MTALPRARIVFEGLEAPLGSLLNLVRLEGWKLVLEQRDELLHHSFYFFGDWDLSTHSDHLPGPGTARGRSSAPMLRRDGDLGTVAPVPRWPSSVCARLLEDGAWTATLFPGALGGVLDGLGDALAQFPLAGLLPSIRSSSPARSRAAPAPVATREPVRGAQAIFQLRIALPALGGATDLPIAGSRGRPWSCAAAPPSVVAGTVSAALQLDAACSSTRTPASP